MSGSLVGRVLLCVALACALGLGCSVLTSSAGLSGGGLDVGADGGALPSDDASEPDTASADRLVGYWAFDEASGAIAFDSSGKGNDATLSDGAVFTPSCGRTAGCLTLSPSGPGIQVTALDGAAFPRSGTFSIWFRWNAMIQSAEQSLLDTWDDGRNHLVLRHANDAPIGEIQGHLASTTLDSPYYVWVTGFPTTAGRWTHVVLTWDEAALEAVLFVDGSEAYRSRYAAYFVPIDQRFRIGAGLDGQIDDARLYARALTPQEVLALP